MNNYSIQDAAFNRVRQVLKEIAAQSYKLATGLQGAAPAQAGGPSNTIRYLLEISLYLDKISQNIESFGLTGSSDNTHSGAP